MDDTVGGSALCFDDFVLNKQSRTLKRGEKLIALRPKSFDVLVYLITHPGVPVSKLDIIDSVWPDVVVSDDSLTRCISDVRQAIGDGDQRMIKTLPRRGYQFAVAVECESLDAPSIDSIAVDVDRVNGPANVTISAGAFSASRPLRWPIRGLLLGLAVLTLAAIYAAGWLREPTVASQSTEPSVAVLPFSSLS